MTGVRVAALCGSLRKGSFNAMALRAAMEVAPAGVTIEPVEWRALPVYDADLETPEHAPDAVNDFRAQLKAADAILIVSPEYNYSVPGGLKNAIDWASRGPQPQSFAGKAVAIMGATGGMIGTARMQYHLRQILVFLDAHPLNKPEVMIARAQDKFDASGKLTDEATRNLIKAQLEALAKWATRLRA